MGKKDKRKEGPVRLDQAYIPGRKYDPDRPLDCRKCFFFDPCKWICDRKECWYLLPPEPVPEEQFDENGNLIFDCRICPYARISPCIGFCIAEIQRDVFTGSRIWKGAK